MFYYKLFIVLAVITIGLTKPTENQRERCCFAKRFSSQVFVTSQNTLPNGTKAASYDVVNGLFATRSTISATNNSFNTFWNSFDYKNKVKYTIFPAENLCQKHTIVYYREICIPESETYTNSSMYNYNGKEILTDTWINDVFGSISYQKVSRNACVQLESGFIMESAGIISTSVTRDYVEEIVDPTIFAIRHECH